MTCPTENKDYQAYNLGVVENNPSSRTKKDPSANIVINDYQAYLKELKVKGCCRRTDRPDQPALCVKPTWLDEDLFRHAKSVYQRHFMGVNFAHLSGLLLLIRVDSIFRTLNQTGESSSVRRLFRRYYHTVMHVKSWYEGDIFEQNGPAQLSLMIVRGMHNKVSAKLNNTATIRRSDVNESGYSDPYTDGIDENSNVDPYINGSQQQQQQHQQQRQQQQQSKQQTRYHLSEYDIMITQFAFIGFIVTNAKYVGLIDDFTHRDLESLLHFWRVIGFYLGASDEFNLCSYDTEQIINLCQAISEVEYSGSIAKNPINSPPGIMSINIVRSVKFIPMITIYGMMKYLYELLGIDTIEIENKATRYSRLSYTLIKLVMSNLLQYRLLRSFNNGLTRLSLYAVGKVEDWFGQRLESKYGTELNL